ncbi:tail assembly chaperone [Streptomyces phage Vanseggelen]|uniref:Tail assembly chaperone n=1 Tax=Streptomyces phage Vanseggelen TaxID=3065246 RepID=A0AA50ICU6_9CAUD|nr:tail assembly chaperone [Streptomyces phage Vanseggelen]
MTADMYDALNQNTRATGQWGKKGPPKIPEYPRPKAKKDKSEKKKFKSVADIYKAFSRR